MLFQIVHIYSVNAIQQGASLTKDTLIVNKLNEKAPTFWSSKPDSTLRLAKRALEISTNLGFMKGQMVAYRNLGIGYYEKGQYTAAAQSYKEAVSLAEILGNDAYKAQLHSNVSMPYLALGAHDEALENLYTALEIAEKNDLTNTIAHANHNIGMVYHYQFKNDEAIAFYEKSRHLYESNGDTTRSTFILGNIAHLYLKKSDFKKAKEFYLQSLALAEKQDNKKAIGNALQSLGAFFMEQKDTETALHYFLRAKETLESTGEQTEYLRLMNNLATCYLEVGDTNTAYTYAAKSNKLANEQQQFYYIQTSAQQLSDLYEKKGNYRMAMHYLKKAALASDSLYSRQNREELVRMEEKYKYRKGLEQTSFLHNMQLKRQNQWLYAAIVLVCILVIIALLFASNIRQKRRTNLILKETNVFFEEQNAKLEASNHFKEQLISLVAHDIRHPIVSLQNVLFLFENKHLSPIEIQQLMSSSHKDVNNLIPLIDDLLLWVKLQLNYAQLQKISFSIQEVSQSIVELYQQKAHHKNIQLIIEPTINTQVYADKEAVATVIRNLVDNGIKFSKPGGSVRIRTTPTAGDGRVTIHIADTGIGMSAETIENLFTTPNYARRLGTNNEEGSGLGLQICIHYLQLNNSKLFVKSILGRGTSFWFEIDTVEQL
ncbi:tetratricopeptide repeat-containing sensor histidine kinase [Sphingobacterium haloxyli]|uniref:tetratricopeptide repeat-containing sensor histidine kinase n=1 Tax=Sphingobacterium haloxyli TaxID=2100533 RepID=UPI0013FDD096|nr:HAMP domain-containing sensor histidine kinase [Sphingobacterium haloxyli]